MERRWSAGTSLTQGVGATASTNNNECWDSVSHLESAFHHGFIRQQLKTGDFVYHEDPRLTQELDEFCDVDSMRTPKGPVILLGESGVGKSAFLANWLVRRKKMFQNWQSSYPELIFSHIVGCSRQSCSVSNFLERFLREIKEYFELNKDVPDVEERLSWQFPRFLEAASKKGRVILVVDGLHRLSTNYGESILKWMPLAFPPNVRIIFSGTLTCPTAKLSQVGNISGGVGRGDEGGRNERAVAGDYYEQANTLFQMIGRIKVEAGRRNWKVIQVLPLAEDDRRHIIDKFISKTRDPSTLENNGLSNRATTGLQLFEIQQNAIVGVPMSANPHFLRNFLLCVQWAAKEGFDIHTIFENWLSADCVGQLLESVLRSMEIGHTPDGHSTDDALHFLLEHESAASITNSALIHNSSGDAHFFGRKHTLHRNDSRIKLELTRVAADVASLHDTERDKGGDNNCITGLNEVKRDKSAHETKELFVHMARADGTPSQPVSAEGGPVSPSLDSYSPTRSFATSAPLHAAQQKPKYNATESRCDPLKLGNRPDYLTGGRPVAPLGKLLGPALCLLYVSRHGLLLNELRFILNTIVTEIREGKEKTSFDEAQETATLEQECLTAFSEEEWQALLRALKVLSVLFVQNVVALPVCSDALRDVIWWRYFGDERAEQQYHQWLIRFFRIHPTTFRRVEELPWHLKRCYQWDTLRQVLVNLPMFQLLYTANYKSELFEYWRLLTDGPLLNYGAVNSSASSSYVTQFDIVKEYGRSIDDWYQSTRPSTTNFTAIIQLITRFMYEFCLLTQRPLPHFAHAPFDLKRLYLDGFRFVENLPHVQTMTNSAGATSNSPLSSMQSTRSSSSIATAASSTLLAALDIFPPQANASSTESAASSLKDKDTAGNCFFTYQRWVWVQFPWLALGCEIIVRDAVVPNPILEKTNDASACSNNIESGLTSQVFHNASTNSLVPFGLSHGRSSNGGVDEETRRLDGEDGCTFKATGSSSVQLLGRSKMFDAQYWDDKKNRFDLTTHRSAGKMITPQLASMKKGKLLTTLASTPLTNQTRDVILPQPLLRKKTAYATVKKLQSSSVHRLPTVPALQASASLPMLPEQRALTLSATTKKASDSERSVGKLDASMLDASMLDASMLEASSAERPASFPSLIVEVGGSASKPSRGSKEVKLNSIFSTDDLVSVDATFGLPAHFRVYPQSEWDQSQVSSYRMVLKLQTLYDTVKTEVVRKQKYLHDVKCKIRETARRYKLTMRECDMAKRAAEEMSSRVKKLEQVMKNIEHQEKSHRKLIRGCEMFPACTSTYYETNKKELRFLQMKLKAFQTEKKVLRVKKAHLQNEELPVLRKAVDKSKQLLSVVVDKLERAREQVAHDQTSSGKLHQRRLEMVKSVRTATGKGLDPTIEEETRRQARPSTTQSLAEKVALQQCDTVCEKIQKATGFSKMELILQKLTRREELNADFDEQAKLYEARLKQIKLNQAELEKQLHSLELSQVTVPTEDPWVLEQKLRAAELELVRTEHVQASLLTSSKEVITGAARIIKLMGITNCFDPHQSAIPAARLWPPPIVYEGENSIASELETLEPSKIAALLQLCQDRATLMIDAIEGVKTDPDMNFSLLADSSSSRSRRWMTHKADEKTTTRTSRYRRALQPSSVVEKEKDRVGFDRGAVPPLDAAISVHHTALMTPPKMPDMNDEDEYEYSLDHEVLSRQVIKASSKSKLAQRKQQRG